jgi:hypothetical protein
LDDESKSMANKSKAVTKEPVAQCPAPADLEKHNPQLSHLAGSKYDDWNTLVANQALNSAWYASKMNPEQRKKMQFGLLCFLSGVEPKDELEGLLASQLLASHNAAMECYRRAMLPEQTFEGRRENLNQANKLSRTHATLLEALNRHRGKGQQKVTVEHVHVHAGGQAVVGVVATPATPAGQAPGGGDRVDSEEQSHAKQIAHAPQPALPSPDAGRDALPIARHAERALPDARRSVARSTKR